MIPTKNSHSVSEHEYRSKTVTINPENLVYLQELISGDIYSNKVLALIREYSCNAYDANVAAGRKDIPIQISLPGRFSSQLKIRDFGNGLTQDEMDSIYASIGESTKRNTNTQVGSFGLGCKAGYSYGSCSFLVNSYQNGIKTAYNCVKGQVTFAEIITIGSCATTEPDGLEIIINVNRDDISVFREEAIKFFKYWDVMPVIEGFTQDDYNGIRGNDKCVVEGTGWKVCSSSNLYGRRGGSVALMGNIAYPIVWSNVKGFADFVTKHSNSDTRYDLEYFITDTNILLNFNIGDIKMSPNREALQYTDFTNNAILGRLQVLIEEVGKIVQTKVDTTTNVWDARCVYEEMFGGHGGPLYRLRGSISVTYKNQVINSNSIGGFDSHKHVLKTYIRRSNRVNFYGYDCGGYNYTKIECGSKRMVLEIDQTDKVYIQKAIQYLAQLRGVSTVYVLTFKDAAERAVVFANTGLDDVFITKYSSISDVVKKTIIRNGRSSTVKVDSTIRSIRVLSNSSYVRYNTRVNDLGSVDTDLAAGGVYVETDNNTITGTKHDMHAISNLVNRIAKINKMDVCVHFIGQNYIDGKLMKQGNWVKFDDYLDSEAKKLVAADSTLAEAAAYDAFISTPGSPNLSDAMLKFVKKGKYPSFTKLIELAEYKTSDAKTVLAATTKPIASDIKVIAELFAKVNKQYPLFPVFNETLGYVNGDLSAVEDYFKSNS